MSKSGQAFVAATEGHSFTLYAMMKAMDIPLTEEQAKYQAYLERAYPAVVIKAESDVHCNRCNWQGMTDQLKAIYKSNSSEPGDITPTPGCPACLSDQWLEYKEN